MSGMVDLFRVLFGVNLLLLAGLLAIWLRNYLEFRSKHTLGLVLFSAFLLAENALGLYMFFLDDTLTAWILDPEFVPPIAQMAMLALRVLETGGIAFLLWVTLD
ncbi:hypothetical protein [Halomarina oriensis]|uniref:Uncharacterized protein n=1 Tax=Halomarina oriensis TaxID=671145 RepID=A0A6B0GMM4_9EURY|nr:hypothetical protein [Halomarina oriensis]MWG36112.1 hypothetical protein [Halomarina oriensis]